MKTTLRIFLSTSLALIGLLVGCTASKTPDASMPAPTPAPVSEAAPTESAAPTPVPDSASAPISIPDTADAIWLAIDQHSNELKAAIDSGMLVSVHHHAFAIRDLVAALPKHSPTLPENDAAKLTEDVKYVATLANRLDTTGDAGDKTGVTENYAQLVTVLEGITRTK